MTQELWKCLCLLKDLMVFLSLGESLGTCIFEASTGQLSLETAEAALVAFLSPVFHLDRGLHHPEAEYSLKVWA